MTNDEAGGCKPIELGFSVENVRFMKPGDRSRCIKYKADYGITMPRNKLELCTFAATMPRMPSKNKVVRVLFWANMETPGDVVRNVAAVVQVLSVQKARPQAN